VIGLFLACADPEAVVIDREAAGVRAMMILDDELVGVRDAIVKGDLHEARTRAGIALASLPELPAGPEGAEQALRLALDDLSEANDVPVAAAALGRVATACAACHLGEGGDRPPWEHRSTRPAEMERHAETVDRLWVALIRPSEPELRAAVADLERQAGLPWSSSVDLRVRSLARALHEAPPAARGDAFGELLAACAGCHQGRRTYVVPEIAGVALPDLAGAMNEHYFDAVLLQLAVIGGDLDEVRRAARELATLPEEAALPEAARPYAADVREAAGRAAAATTIAGAGAAVGDLARACGRCHTAAGAGPREPIEPAPSEPHMAVHVYGVYWMGYGVYAPDERAWVAGAGALASAELGSDDAVEARVHALARRAAATTDAEARADVWGELLATCSPCHAAARP